MSRKKKELKETIKDELGKMLAKNEEPSEGRMKLLTLGIKYLAVEAKLDENQYGGFFDGDGDTEVGRSNAKRKASGISLGEAGDTFTNDLLGGDPDEGSVPS